MKTSIAFTLASTFALLAPSVVAYERKLEEERRLGNGWAKGDYKEKYLGIYQRCCDQTDDVLEDHKTSPCRCPVRTFEGWMGYFNQKAKWEDKCQDKIPDKAAISDFTVVGDKQSIVDIAVADGRFKTLVKLVGDNGLAETLSGPGPFTVFAPTDEAFAAAGDLSQLDVAEVLKFHVVQSNAPSRTLSDEQMVPTVEGQSVKISISDDKVKVGPAVGGGKAEVIIRDILANNGVIHVVDKVLLPPGAN